MNKLNYFAYLTNIIIIIIIMFRSYGPSDSFHFIRNCPITFLAVNLSVFSSDKRVLQHPYWLSICSTWFLHFFRYFSILVLMGVICSLCWISSFLILLNSIRPTDLLKNRISVVSILGMSTFLRQQASLLLITELPLLYEFLFLIL